MTKLHIQTLIIIFSILIFNIFIFKIYLYFSQSFLKLFIEMIHTTFLLSVRNYLVKNKCDNIFIINNVKILNNYELLNTFKSNKFWV